jgi:hypothetical protein
MTRVTIVWVLLTGLASPALASAYLGTCTTASQDKWMSEADAQAKIAQAGYKVAMIMRSKSNNNCYQVYATDKNGKQMELFIDPTNANIIYSVED